MKVAIPHWQGRVSPVFDVAGKVLVVDFDGGREQSRQDVVFDAEQPQIRAGRLADTGADVLVCGAISWPLEMAIVARGIRVIPHTCGEVESVLQAFNNGGLDGDAFLMPGCCGRRRRRSCGGRRRQRRAGHGRAP